MAYRTEALDLAWVPPEALVVVVHNDDALPESACEHPRVRHVRPGGNVGFGGGVNAALDHVEGERVIVCNPDTHLERLHWDALTGASEGEIVSVPQVEPDGTVTSVVNRYPGPVSLTLTAYRAGRLARRGGRLRRLALPLLGRWGRAHDESLRAAPGAWPLVDRWVSGAVFSVHAGRLRSVGGLDPSYFLYLEDVDLCRRLAVTHPDMVARVADVRPAIHGVGGSSPSPEARRAADAHAARSAQRYAAGRRGVAWRLCRAALAPRARWLER